MTNNPLEDPMESLNHPGSPTRPIHHNPHTWDEDTKQLEESIRSSVPFEGKWQSFIESYRLKIPESLQHLFDAGGVITVGTEAHLLLFGNRHWSRMQRILSKEVGLSPVNNEVARHIYSHMHRFNKLNEDGTIDVPMELAQYAGLTKDVAIIGLIYHAEIHDKQSFLTSENPDNRKSMLDRFREMRFN